MVSDAKVPSLLLQSRTISASRMFLRSPYWPIKGEDRYIVPYGPNLCLFCQIAGCTLSGVWERWRLGNQVLGVKNYSAALWELVLPEFSDGSWADLKFPRIRLPGNDCPIVLCEGGSLYVSRCRNMTLNKIV
jgi:hypothetical protein